MEFTDSTGRLVVHQAGSLPAWLQERYQLLRYFATYMEENLTEAGDVRSSRAVVGRGNVIPHVRRWDRTPKSIIMQLSNGTFQACVLARLSLFSKLEVQIFGVIVTRKGNGTLS